MHTGSNQKLEPRKARECELLTLKSSAVHLNDSAGREKKCAVGALQEGEGGGADLATLLRPRTLPLGR